jgi:hypothetical protein
MMKATIILISRLVDHVEIAGQQPRLRVGRAELTKLIQEGGLLRIDRWAVHRSQPLAFPRRNVGDPDRHRVAGTDGGRNGPADGFPSDQDTSTRPRGGEVGVIKRRAPNLYYIIVTNYMQLSFLQTHY